MKIKPRVNVSFKSGKDSGFTLIELLVVIIIIGILAGIAVVGVSGARNSAQKAACKADAAQLIKGLRAYSAASNLAFPGSRTSGTFLFAEVEQLWDAASTKGKFIETEIGAYGKTVSGAWTSDPTDVGSAYVLKAVVSSSNLTVTGYAAGTADEFQSDCEVTG
jgi:prepilin-type N-terminal cleavage/methylation domain-containing protein